ncbi:IS66 family transposase [Paraburkholderia domus]|uniref:IS66 family transposase n=1 Tax=Paraburkholderia domus TaxID=2793075 RepID=UPI0038B396D7
MNASASLLANILVNTYVDHLPLNRQEMRYARRGAHLPRQRCANGSWRRLSCSKCGRYRCGLPVAGPPHARG